MPSGVRRSTDDPLAVKHYHVFPPPVRNTDIASVSSRGKGVGETSVGVDLFF